MDFREKVQRVIDAAKDESGALPIGRLGELPKPSHRDRWGNWELDAERLVLFYSPYDRLNKYEIDLESMGTSAAMLDWIFQLNGKSWVTKEDIGISSRP